MEKQGTKLEDLRIKTKDQRIESTLINEQPFSIDFKGGGKAKRGFYKESRGRVFPSMPKGETVGNVVIVGKADGKGGVPELEMRQSSRHEVEAVV